MPFQYENISSPYIRAQLEVTPWENHGAVDDLIRLAEIIDAGGPHSYAGALLYHYLTDHYPEASQALLDEAGDGRALLLSQEQKERTDALARYEDERLATEREARASWLRAGGR